MSWICTYIQLDRTDTERQAVRVHSEDGVCWCFTVPASPFFAGLRMTGSCSFHSYIHRQSPHDWQRCLRSLHDRPHLSALRDCETSQLPQSVHRVHSSCIRCDTSQQSILPPVISSDKSCVHTREMPASAVGMHLPKGRCYSVALVTSPALENTITKSIRIRDQEKGNWAEFTCPQLTPESPSFSKT